MFTHYNTFYNICVFFLGLHSWNFFVAICCIPALTTGITFIFMPESPKFLIATGKTDKALTVFKKVYKKNTGRRFSSFPVRTSIFKIVNCNRIHFVRRLKHSKGTMLKNQMMKVRMKKNKQLEHN